MYFHKVLAVATLLLLGVSSLPQPQEASPASSATGPSETGSTGGSPSRWGVSKEHAEEGPHQKVHGSHGFVDFAGYENKNENNNNNNNPPNSVTTDISSASSAAASSTITTTSTVGGSKNRR